VPSCDSRPAHFGISAIDAACPKTRLYDGTCRCLVSRHSLKACSTLVSAVAGKAGAACFVACSSRSEFDQRRRLAPTRPKNEIPTAIRVALPGRHRDVRVAPTDVTVDGADDIANELSRLHHIDHHAGPPVRRTRASSLTSSRRAMPIARALC